MRDRDVLEARLRPADPEHVAVLAEDPADVCRVVGEEVADVRVLGDAAARELRLESVDAPRAVRMDQAAEEFDADDVGELTSARMASSMVRRCLRPGPCCGKASVQPGSQHELSTGSRARRESNVHARQRQSHGGPASQTIPGYRASRVTHSCQPFGLGAAEAAVPQVETEQIAVDPAIRRPRPTWRPGRRPWRSPRLRQYRIVEHGTPSCAASGSEAHPVGQQLSCALCTAPTVLMRTYVRLPRRRNGQHGS